ncbi:MAG: 50S ribosomal protein L10 [Coriobacteriales bacterium]|nr:50S ribosomal protein L10 [Coriobacteriales bacterium]
MATQKKIEAVAEFSESLQQYDGFYVVNYSGLTVKQMGKLRKQLRELDAKCTVYKNNLVRRALSAAEKPEMGEILDGTNAIVFFKQDAAAAGKVLKGFAKENKALVIKGALVDGGVLDADGANAVADLPRRSELLSRVLATMLNPMSQIARVVDLIREQKEEAA